MKKLLAVLLFMSLMGCGTTGGSKPPPPPPPEPPPRPAPRLLLHDWFGSSPVCTPGFIQANKDYLDGLPFDGVAVYMRKPDLTDNITISVMSNERLDPQRIAAVLAPIKGLAFRSLTSNFAAVISKVPPDFFDDWTTVAQNFADVARAAKDAGLRGIYFDNETYYAPWTDYPAGVKYKAKSLKEYQDQAFLRGKQVMEALTGAFPGLVLITLHGPYLSEPKAPAPLFPQWQASNELKGPFFAGFFAGRKTGLCVDGGELYHLRTPDEFERAYQWRKRTIASAEIDCAFIPGPLRASWDQVSVGFGIYDRPFGGRPMSPEVLRQTVANALRRADDYVWFYVEGPTFLKPPDKGGAPETWRDAIWRARVQER